MSFKVEAKQLVPLLKFTVRGSDRRFMELSSLLQTDNAPHSRIIPLDIRCNSRSQSRRIDTRIVTGDISLATTRQRADDTCEGVITAGGSRTDILSPIRYRSNDRGTVVRHKREEGGWA